MTQCHVCYSIVPAAAEGPDEAGHPVADPRRDMPARWVWGPGHGCRSQCSGHICARLCPKNCPADAPAGFQERRDDHVLREFVDSEARNFTGERFNRFALEMNQRIKSLIRRSEGSGACP